jgi:NADH-quinone oxidoreductase subunit C
VVAKVSEELLERFPDTVTAFPSFREEEVFVIHNKDRLLEVLQFLSTFPGSAFQLLEDICGVDYPGRNKRFEVVYHLVSIKHNHSLVLKTRCYDREKPVVPSVVVLWQGADFQEREIFDLMGINSRGIPT